MHLMEYTVHKDVIANTVDNSNFILKFAGAVRNNKTVLHKDNLNPH